MDRPNSSSTQGTSQPCSEQKQPQGKVKHISHFQLWNTACVAWPSETKAQRDMEILLKSCSR